MENASPDHYATLGLERDCTAAEVRAAYRTLAKQHHPDVNAESPDAPARMEALNSAYETLSDPSRRRAYDRGDTENAIPRSRGRIERNINQDVSLRIEELLRGTSLEVQVRDPANPGSEHYSLTVPAGTAPGTRYRLPRNNGGFVQVRVRVSPNFRFKARGADLRCDLRIDARRAAEGGTETIPGATGTMLRLQIPPGVGRGEILRIPSEGLPKARGGRGNLLVRITYRPEVRITRGRVA